MAGLRKSRQSEIILEVLKGTTSHPDAEWVYERVRERVPRVSLGTVYRNLAKMAESGEILKLGVGTSVSHYDGNPKPHSHAVCRRCGRIDDLFGEISETVRAEGERLYNGVITDCTVTYYGFCESCAEYELTQEKD